MESTQEEKGSQLYRTDFPFREHKEPLDWTTSTDERDWVQPRPQGFLP